MEKHLLKRIQYYLFFAISLLYFQYTNAQVGTGYLVEYQQQVDLQLRGDMQVIGNNIMGVRGSFDGDSNRDPNEEYNGTNNNGSNAQPRRAYIDIDSDRSDPRFGPLFSAGLSNTQTDYNGDVDINGRPEPSFNGDSQSNYTGTFNSSAARLSIDPNCATVVRAYLYWGAIYTTDGLRSGSTDRSSRNLFNSNDDERESADFTEIKILPPNGTQYYDISKQNLDGSSRTNNPNGLVFQTEVIFDGQDNSYFNNNILRQQDIDGGTPDPALTDPAITTQRRRFLRDRSRGNTPLLPGDPTQDRPYACRADITELFTTLDTNGEDIAGWWTVANLRATTGRRSRGLAGGWTLAVVYEDANITNERRIFFFDGFSYISNLDAGDPVSFDVGPFTTDPNANPIQASLAAAGLEGDRSFGGDQFLISTQTTQALGGPRQLVESELNRHHSVPNIAGGNGGNFFNSTITNSQINGVFRQPNSSNTLGFDTDQFELQNDGNRILDNGRGPAMITDTQATLILDTERESFGNHFVGFAVDIIGPNVTLLKEAFRATDPLTALPNNAAIEFEDELIYKLTLQNIGNDDATELSFTDFIPANTQLLRLDGTEATITPGNIRQFFDFDNSVPNEGNISIVQSRENAPGSITNFPFETDRIDFSNFPILSRADCTNCEGSDRTREITIEFRVRVLGECDQARRACYDQVSNSVIGEYNGTLLRRDPNTQSLFPIRSANSVDINCNNNLILGPTIQLPNRLGRCDSQVGTICEQGGRTDITGNLGFSRYNLYFYPLADIDDANGNIVDTNGTGTIDDADYPIDPSRLLFSQILPGSNFAIPPLFNPSEPNVSITANPHIFRDINNGAGFYIIESITDPNLGCSDSLETFNVGLFDATLPINRPLEDPALRGTILPTCTVNNSAMVQFEICQGQFEIPTNYPPDTRLVWSRVDPNTCTMPNSPENCPITGPSGCDYIPFKTVEDTVPGDPVTENVMITQTGDYSLTATLENGGCTETFFFRVIDFQNNLDVTAPTITSCNDNPILRVSGTNTTAGTQQYQIRYLVDDPATPGINFVLQETDNPGDTGYAEFAVPRPSTLPATVNVRTEIVPISPSVIRGTGCVFTFDRPVQFNQPEIIDFSLVRTPSCIEDQPGAPANQDESKGDLRVEVTDDSEEYTYVLINTQGTTADESDDVVIRSFNSTDNINTDNLRNIDPDVEYKIRVYLNGEVPRAGLNDERLDVSALPDNQCILEEILVPFPAAENFNAEFSLIRQVSCEPGIITVVFTEPIPAPATANFTIIDLGLFSQPLGRRIRIQDETLRPAVVTEDNVNAGISVDNGTGEDQIFYFDLSTITSFDVIINSNASCGRTLNNIAFPLRPYEGIKVPEPITPTNVRCNGGMDGAFTAMATDLADGPLDPATTVDFQIVSGDNATVTYPVTSTDGNFDSLPAGVYQVVARNITDPINPCISEEVTVTITQPNPLLAPTIRQESDFTCNDTASITVIVGGTGDDATAPVITATTDLGGTRPYRFQLFRNSSTTPESTPGLLIADLPFTGLVEGSYTVGIVDANGCPLSPLSNTITIGPRSEITAISEAHGPILCATDNSTNPTTEVTITATANNIITGRPEIARYEITTATPDDATLAASILGTNNTTGVFDLPPGDYVITATTSSECTDTVPVDIDPLLRIDISSLPNPSAPNCIGDVVSATATIVGFNPTTTPPGGYTYELTRNGVIDGTASNSSTATVTSNSVSLTNLTPTTATDFYTLTVTDIITGCTDTANINIPEPDPLPTVMATIETFQCTTSSTGTYTITVQGSGGNGSAYEFSLEDSDSSTPNATANIAFRAGNTFTVAAPTTGSDVYTISVRDDRNCTPPNTTTVTIDAIEPFTAVLDSASDLCAVAASPVTVTIDVTGTPGFSYRLLREGVAVGATVPVASITAPATSGSFTVDLPNPSATAVTNYEIFVSDLRHPDTACEIEIPIMINPPVAVGTANEIQPDCMSTSGALPTSGATVNFPVSGGTGTYVYTVINTSNANADITANPGVTQTGSNSSPTFGFSNAFDGDTIEIRITDNAGTPCPANRVVTFTPMYPTAPVVDSEVFDPAKCFGGSSRFTVNLPTGANLNDFTFIFNGSDLGSQNFINNPTAGPLNYSVENNATGCITTGSVTIQEPSEITEVSRMINPSRCDASSTPPGQTIPGGFELTVAGGFITNPAAPIATPFPTPGNQAGATYTFVIRELGGTIPLTPTTTPSASNPIITNNAAGTTVEYTDLDPGTYEVEAILNDGDADPTNNCSERFVIVLPSEPFVNVVNTQFNTTNCAAGVELYVVIDGGADPSQFEMFIDRVDTIFLNPSATDTDYIARLGNPDFLEANLPAGITVPDTPGDYSSPPLFQPAGPLTPAQLVTFAADARSRFFRFTGLPPGGKYRIFVRDAVTGCITEAEVDAPDATDVNVTAVATTNTGSCLPPSGTATVTFSITDDPGLLGQYEIQLERPGLPDDANERIVVEVVDPSTPLPLGPNQVTGTRNAGNIEGVTATLTGLPEVLITENAVIRVRQIGGTDCSDVSDILTIGMDPPIADFEVTTQAGDCETGAFLSFTVTGGNGNYEFIVVNPNDTPQPDALTPFPISTPPSTTIPIDLNNLDSRIDTAAPTAAEITADARFSQENFLGRVRASVKSANCVETQIVPIFFNRRPTLTFGDVIAPNCTTERLPNSINYTIGNFDPNQTYEFTVNGTTIIPINNASLTVTGSAPTRSAAGVLTVNEGARIYNVSLSGSANNNCTATDSFTIYPDITAIATPTAARCDDQFDSITVEASGGFEDQPGPTPVATRELLYELIQVSGGAVIATQTTSNTTVIFTNDAGNTLDLLAGTGTQYQVRVTDRFDPNVVPVRESCPLTIDVPEVLPVVVPTFTLAQSEVTCPLDNDGSVTFTITNPGNTPQPPTFRLYQFGTLAEANAAIAAANGVASDYSMVNGTLLNNLTNSNNYPGLTAGPYVGFLETQGLNCPTDAQLIEVVAPVVPLQADFTVSADFAGTDCTNVDRSDDNPSLVIVVNGVNPVGAQLTYAVTSTTSSFNINPTPITITSGLPFTVPGTPELPADLFNDNTYTVTIRNTNQPTCPPLTYTVPVPRCPGMTPPPLIVTTNPGEVPCDDTPTGTASFTVSGAATLNYTFEINGGPFTVVAPPTPIPAVGTPTSEPTINLSGLTVGTLYEILVFDRSDPRITAPIRQTITLDAPDAITITPGTPTTTCVSNTPQLSVEYTVANGTGPYTFTLRNDDTNVIVNGPVTPTGNTQTFNYTASGNYNITVVDSNPAMCDAEITFPIVVPDPIAGTVTVNDECLPGIEFEINITSGQGPYDYRVFEVSATPGAFIEGFASARIPDNTSITSAGTYRVEIRDANSCSVFTMPDFTINPQLSTTVARMEPRCSPTTPPADPQDRTDGQVTVTAANGNGSYTFELAELSSATQDPTSLFQTPTSVISTATTTPTSLSFNVTEANRDNFYVVKVTDGNMCELITRIDPFTFPETPVANFMSSDIVCAGDTGSFTINPPTVGVGPFTYVIFEGTTRPTPTGPATSIFNDPLLNNTITQTSNVQRTYTYIVRDNNGCESMPQQVTINDNSVQLARITSTPVTCIGMPPTNDNGTITLEIQRGRTDFTYTIFDTATNTQVLVPDNLDTVTADGTATTPNRTITFTGLTIGNYEIRVLDNVGGVAPICNTVSFFREVESASPIDIGPAIYSDCVGTGGSVTALFRISSDNLPFIESPLAGGAPIDPSIDLLDDVFRYTDLSPAEQVALNAATGFTPNIGTEGTYYGVTGLVANRAYSLEVVDSVTMCNDVLNLDAEEDLVSITNVEITPDSDCATGTNVVEGELEVTFEVGSSGAAFFDVTLLDANDLVIVTTGGATNANPRNGVAPGTITFSNLPVGRYKVRVDEPGGQCGDESEIQELIQAPQLELPRVVSQTNQSCASFGTPVQLAVVNVAASGGILFDPSSPTDTNGYLFALVPDGVVPVAGDFVDEVSFQRDFTINTDWDLYVRDNSSCDARGPVDVTIDINPEPAIALVTPFSANQCNGPAFPIEVNVTNYDPDRAPYNFEILDDNVASPTVLVGNAGTIDNTGTAPTATTTLTIANRGAFQIRVTDRNGCNVTIPFTVYEELEVVATVGDVECDDTITQVEAEISGGFTAGAREIVYQLFVEGNATPVNTFTQPIAVATANPSHIFTEDNAATPNPLQAGVRYVVTVTDDFGIATAPNCEATSTAVIGNPIIKSTPVDLEAIAEILCPAAPNNVGSVRFNTTIPPGSPSPSLPETFELYRFDTEANAISYIAALPVTPIAPILGTTPNFIGDGDADADEISGTLRSGTTNTFDDLVAGTYVGFVINNGCYTVFPEPITLDPVTYIAPNITVTEVAGTCTPLVRAPFIRIEVVDLVSDNRPYEYRIDDVGGTNTFIVIAGTEVGATPTLPIVLEIPIAAGMHTVEFRGTINDICGIPSPVPSTTVDVPNFVLPQITVERNAAAMNSGALNCFSPESVRVSVTGAEGDTFTIQAIPLVGSTPTTTSPNPQVGLVVPVGATEVEAIFEFSEGGRYEFEAINTNTTCDITSDPYIIEDLEPLQVRVTGNPGVECVGDTNEAISFIVDNYIGFITYQVRDTSVPVTDPLAIAATTVEVTATTNEFSTTAILGAGNYELTVTAATDATGAPLSTNMLCADTQPASILAAPQQVTLMAGTPTVITCANEFTSFQVTASQGVPPYRFQLSNSSSTVIVDFAENGETNPNTTGFFGTDLMLGGDTYTIVVRDANNCEAAMPATVTPMVFTANPMITNTIPTNPLCETETTGTIRVEATLVNNIPTSTEFTYTLYTVTGNTLAEIDARVESSSVRITNSDHTFTAIAGNNGNPRFYVVGVSDEFGCEAISAVQTIEKPAALTFEAPDLLEAISCEIRDVSKGETEQVRINATGGTPIVGPNAYTIQLLARNADGSRTEPIAVVETNNSSGLGFAEFELVPGPNYFRVLDNNSCPAFTVVEVADAPEPIDYDIIPQDRNILCFGETDFVDIDGNVTGGVADYGYSLVIGTPSGSTFTEVTEVVNEAGVNVNADLPSAALAGLTRFEGLRGLQLLLGTTTAVATYPTDATYLYKVTSGTCDPVYMPFEIRERSEIIVDTPEVREPSCIDEPDAEVTITISSGDDGEYSLVVIREEGGVFDINVSGVARLLNLTATNRSLTFTNLMAGDYQLLVSGNDCPLEAIPFTINNKTQLMVTEAGRMAPNCPGDASSVTYTVSGGTPPYFYRVVDIEALENGDATQEILFPEIQVWGNPNNVVLTSGSTFTVDEDNSGSPLRNNNRYQVVVVDSGNERYDLTAAAAMPPTYISDTDASGDTLLKVCQPVTPNGFIFDVPDLTGFTVEEEYVCDTGQYTLTVSLPNDTELVEGNVMYVLNNLTTPTTPNPLRQSSNIFTNVDPGDVEVSIEYVNPANPSAPACESSNLPNDEGIEEITLVGFPGLSIVSQPELDENGEVVPNGESIPYELVGLNKYRVSAEGGLPPYTFEVRNIATQDILPLEIDLRGRATFEIIESGNYSISVLDANGCTAFASADDLAFIDIEIPNVFNPSSNDPNVNRWYPDNLFFGSDILPIPSGGIDVGDGSTIITVTIGGTTTGGTVTTLPGGGTAVTGGTTTGATTIVTTINSDGTSTVSVTTGGTVVNGTVTGGTVTPNVDGTVTVTGGTTTGGTLTGGTSGPTVDTGVTALPNTNTVISTTIGNPVTGSTGETTGGIFVETTTRPGPGGTTITTVRVVDIETSGSVTGGTPAGNIVVGGTVTGGTSVESNLPVETVVTGGTTINDGDDFVDFRNIDVMVFDRYGRLLEQFKGILDRKNGEGWDGNYQGNPMPTGDYWYLIKLNDRRGREIKGHFTLYRSK